MPSSDAAVRDEGRRQENAPERPARPRRGSLLSRISQQSFLKDSFKLLRSKRSSFGVDGVSVDTYAFSLAANTYVLSRKLRAGTFRFSPLRPVAVPKGAGKHRPILIPTVEDRVVQRALLRAIAQSLEPLIAFDHSYAFRKGRGVKDAVKALKLALAAKHKFVLVVDINQFFPSVDAQSLLNRLFTLLPDESVAPLLAQLFAWEIDGLPELPEAKRRCFPDAGRGLPQGSLLSPMLANLYLAPFDSEIRRLGIPLIRYADDLAVACESRAEAEAVLGTMRALLGELGLALPQLGEPKCRIWDYAEEGVEYLGCYMWSPSRTVRVKPTTKKFDGALKAISDHLNPANSDTLARRYEALSGFMLGWLAAYGQLCDVSSERAKLLEHFQEHLTALLRQRGFVAPNSGLSASQRQFLSLDDLFRAREPSDHRGSRQKR